MHGHEVNLVHVHYKPIKKNNVHVQVLQFNIAKF